MGLHEHAVQMMHELGQYSGKFGGKVTALFYDKENTLGMLMRWWTLARPLVSDKENMRIP